ncbi:hypothetical protein AB0K16_23145 [Nonomuraea jabiensis]|uniref:hypothetical protein n=1 Tax=Nonomuraea jabiensis TaxID=882448 RepID=UPI0034286757
MASAHASATPLISSSSSAISSTLTRALASRPRSRDRSPARATSASRAAYPRSTAASRSSRAAQDAVRHRRPPLRRGSRDGAAFGIADDLAADVIIEGMEMVASPGSEPLKPSLVELRGRGERLGVRPDGGDGWVIVRSPGGCGGSTGRWRRTRWCRRPSRTSCWGAPATFLSTTPG